MEARKIIQFGNSSHVVSIPKAWIKENKLKKGDLIFFEKNGNGELVLLPKENREEKEKKKIIIDINDKNIMEINRELISVYINNYNEIILNGKTPKLNELKEIIDYKIGLNVIEKRSDQLIIKDLLDPKTLSLQQTIKRMDDLIRSLFSDLKNGLNEKIFNEKTCKNIYDVDDEINKLYFLALKLIKKAVDRPSLLKYFGISQEKILDIYWLVMNFEHLGDEIKRIAKFLAGKRINSSIKKNLVEVIFNVEKIYLDTMKAYFDNNKKFAIEICAEKGKIIKECNDLLKNNPNPIIYQITERLKILEATIHNIAKYVAY